MSEHQASVTVNAPVHQVYELFTHFNDFPKFMSFVKEVTYYDDQRSHWVAQIAGTQEWDAVNEDWLPDQQIGWRSTSGLQNTGKVKFRPLTDQKTTVDVYINYTPPAGVLGAAADKLGVDSHFDKILQEDLNRFAHMIEQSPPGVLDPMQSHYLFNTESASTKGTTTEAQHASMANDPMMQPEALQRRDAIVQREVQQQQEIERAQTSIRERQVTEQQQAAQQQHEVLRQQAERNLEEQQRQQAIEAQAAQQQANREIHPVYDTIGGRNASQERTSLGDQDARSERFPGYHEDPMLARTPEHRNTSKTSLSDVEVESPWSSTTQGSPSESMQSKNLEEDNEPQP